jgi:hypothetical protein
MPCQNAPNAQAYAVGRADKCNLVGREQLRQILTEEQDHQIDLATALGEEVPDALASERWSRRRAS